MSVDENNVNLERLITGLYETRNQFLESACNDSALSYLSQREIEILEIIAAEGKVTMGTLALRSALAMSTLSGIISRLNSLGLIDRSHSPNDRRIIEVRLNRSGREACKYRGEAKKKLYQDILSPLSDDEKTELFRLLEIILSNEESDG